MSLYKIFRPIIFKIESEKAHNLAIFFLRYFPNLANIFSSKRSYKNLRQEICGIKFKNPVGMAAGFDKNACCIKALSGFGFGFVEVGTVTPKPQKGNEKPRIFRLKEDRAIINRLGFNNLGAENFATNLTRISALKTKQDSSNPVVGINIGKNKDSENAISDYLFLLEKFYEKASYITLNISSPNTKNLRDLQSEENLDGFLAEIMKKANELQQKCEIKAPIWLKVAPDLTFEQQEIIAKLVIKHKVDALIVSNTTISRPENLQSKNKEEQGGLSGKPLFEKSNEVLKNFHKLLGKKVPLIAVGGISSAKDAYEKIKSGASLVQIYSALIYEGFGLVEKVNKDLSELLEKDGYDCVEDAVGTS